MLMTADEMIAGAERYRVFVPGLVLGIGSSTADMMLTDDKSEWDAMLRIMESKGFRFEVGMGVTDRDVTVLVAIPRKRERRRKGEMGKWR